MKGAFTLFMSFVMAALLTSCNDMGSPVEVVADGGNFNDPSRCSYVERQIYDLSAGTDLTVDFNQSNVPVTYTVVSSQCNGIYPGAYLTNTVTLAERIGNYIGLHYSDGVDSMTVSGLTLIIPDFSICLSSGVTVYGHLSSGQIKTATSDLELIFSWVLVDNNCLSSPPAAVGEFEPGETPPPIDPGSMDSNGNHFISFVESSATDLLYYYSEPGDYIGQGEEKYYDSGSFIADRNFDNGIRIRFNGDDGSWWTANFAAAGDVPLAVGTYDNATRFPFQNATSHGFDFSGSGRGCNTLTATFIIKQVEYNPDDSVKRFDADFIQHCEAMVPAIYGTIRFNASNPLM